VFGVIAAGQALLIVGGARITATFIEIDCPIRSLTGWQCPGCGSTRCVTALGSGDVPAAFRHNPLLTSALVGSLIVALCGAGFPRSGNAIVSWVQRRKQPFTLLLITIIAAQTVIRNL